MAAIAIVSPDGNRVVGLSCVGNLRTLNRLMKTQSPEVTRDANVDLTGAWAWRFDRIHVPMPRFITDAAKATSRRYRAYRPDDLPEEYWDCI